MNNDSDSLATKCQREIILHPQQNISFGKSISGTKFSSRQKKSAGIQSQQLPGGPETVFCLDKQCGGAGRWCMCMLHQ